MFLVYTKDNCNYCDKTKTLLDSSKIPFKFISKETAEDSITQFKETFNHKTFPFIFHKDSFIGGYSDLLCYIYSDKFKSLEI